MAGFLIVVGLTGTLLAWNDELDALIAPELFHAPPPTPDAPLLDPLDLRARVASRYPAAWALSVPLDPRPGRTVAFFLVPARDLVTRHGASLPDNQIFVNPYDASIAGQRYWGDITQGMKNFMPFVFRLHYTLALGNGAMMLFGVVALSWTLNCFLGAYLTLPPRRPPVAARDPQAWRAWLSRWRPAWRVRPRAGAQAVTLDLHRAAGLWLWLVFFVFAWSAVAFTWPRLYYPVMHAVLPHQPDPKAAPRLSAPVPQPALAWTQARVRGRVLMAQQAAAQGFHILNEDELDYDPYTGLYRYTVTSDRDIRRRNGETTLYVDAATGAMRYLWIPTGMAAGDTLTTWMTNLHTVGMWGKALKAFDTFAGLAVAMLSLTGLLMWLRRRR